VLYVQKLNCNLVSILKLCKQLKCVVTFYDDSCMIQDRTLKTPIGAGEQTEGVYYFRKSSDQVNAVDATSLWNRHLEHSSSEVISLLPHHLGVVSGSNNHKPDMCEICLRAKQTHTKFPVGKNNGKDIFYLINCGI